MLIVSLLDSQLRLVINKKKKICFESNFVLSILHWYIFLQKPRWVTLLCGYGCGASLRCHFCTLVQKSQTGPRLEKQIVRWRWPPSSHGTDGCTVSWEKVLWETVYSTLHGSFLTRGKLCPLLLVGLGLITLSPATLWTVTSVHFTALSLSSEVFSHAVFWLIVPRNVFLIQWIFTTCNSFI